MKAIEHLKSAEAPADGLLAEKALEKELRSASGESIVEQFLGRVEQLIAR